jgi:hypothetical protein
MVVIQIVAIPSLHPNTRFAPVGSADKVVHDRDDA